MAGKIKRHFTICQLFLKPTLSAPISNSGDSFDGRSRCPILDLIKRAPGKWQETLFYEFENRADARE